MSNIDKRALREAAEKATPGSWRYLKSTPFMDAEISAENHTRVVNLLAGDVTADNSECIAAANPATVLALLDELEAAERRNAELINMIGRHTVELGWGEKPITLAELIIAREGSGSDVLDAIRAAAAGKESEHG